MQDKKQPTFDYFHKMNFTNSKIAMQQPHGLDLLHPNHLKNKTNYSEPQSALTEPPPTTST